MKHKKGNNHAKNQATRRKNSKVRKIVNGEPKTFWPEIDLSTPQPVVTEPAPVTEEGSGIIPTATPVIDPTAIAEIIAQTEKDPQGEIIAKESVTTDSTEVKS